MTMMTMQPHEASRMSMCRRRGGGGVRGAPADARAHAERHAHPSIRTWCGARVPTAVGFAASTAGHAAVVRSVLPPPSGRWLLEE